MSKPKAQEVPPTQQLQIIAAANITAAGKMPVAITGTWDGARRWRDAAVMMEEGKLFCQVMLGFELIALRASLNVTRGSSTDVSKVSTSGYNWTDLVEKELGIAHSTAYRMMEMAEAAKGRLKKLPELRDFDPTAVAVSALPAEKLGALKTAVKKITDGQTQVSFSRDLGIAKLPQGSGATGRAKGEGGPGPKPTATEQAELMIQRAREDWLSVEQDLLGGYKELFTLLPDTEVDAQIAALTKALDARRLWMRTPAEKRDPTVIGQIFA